MQIISERGAGVGELANKVGPSQSALLQHLARLRQDQLVSTRREAQNIDYTTDHPGIRRILASLEAVEQQETELCASIDQINIV